MRKKRVVTQQETKALEICTYSAIRLNSIYLKSVYLPNYEKKIEGWRAMLNAARLTKGC